MYTGLEKVPSGSPVQAVTDPGEGEKRLHSQAKIIHVRDNAQNAKRKTQNAIIFSREGLV